MVITNEMVLPIVLGACAIFTFGFGIGLALGKADGRTKAEAEWRDYLVRSDARARENARRWREANRRKAR